MTRLQQCIEALEVELRIKGEDAGYYTGIHEAIAIVTRILSAGPTEDEIAKCKWEISKVFVPDGIWNIEEGIKMERAAKAALLTVFGGRKE